MPTNPSRDVEVERPLPNNIEAERALLGAILVDNKALEVAAEKITPHDLFHTHHIRIFEAMLALEAKQRPIDLVTLTDELNLEGRLETAGGPAYVAQLIDGVPHVSNVGHYCFLVKEKALRRELIRNAWEIQTRALDETEDFAKTYGEAVATIGKLTLGANGTGHHPIKGRNLLALEVAPVAHVIDPILPVKGIGFIYSKEGVGKTLVGLEIAIAIATAREGLNTRIFGQTSPWIVPTPRRVLYVDGEMPIEEIKERFEGLCLGRGQSLIADEVDNFQAITNDLEDKAPNIVTDEGQQHIEKHLKDGDVLILDNLSCLGHVQGVSSNEAESWWATQPWLLRLRRRSITSIVMHHAGKSGDQLGTAAKKFAVHTVIQFKHPSDYVASEGLRCEVKFEKVRRYKAKNSMAFMPFELKMEEDPRGALYWLRRPLQDVQEANVIELYKTGMSPTEISQDSGVERTKVYRILTDAGLREKKKAPPRPDAPGSNRSDIGA